MCKIILTENLGILLEYQTILILTQTLIPEMPVTMVRISWKSEIGLLQNFLENTFLFLCTGQNFLKNFLQNFLKSGNFL